MQICIKGMNKLSSVIFNCTDHCCVPLCSVSSRYNSCASFHSFPVKEEIRKKWILNIRRINFQITKHTKVCSVHFKPDYFVEGVTELPDTKVSVENSEFIYRN